MNFLKQAIHDLISEDGLVVMPRECGCIEVFALIFNLSTSCFLILSNIILKHANNLANWFLFLMPRIMYLLYRI